MGAAHGCATQCVCGGVGGILPPPNHDLLCRGHISLAHRKFSEWSGAFESPFSQRFKKYWDAREKMEGGGSELHKPCPPPLPGETKGGTEWCHHGQPMSVWGVCVPWAAKVGPYLFSQMEFFGSEWRVWKPCAPSFQRVWGCQGKFLREGGRIPQSLWPPSPIHTALPREGQNSPIGPGTTLDPPT